MALLFDLSVGVPVWLAAIGAVVLGAAFDWAQDWGLWSRLRRRDTGLVSAMIISIGVALLIRLATLFFVCGERQCYTEYAGQQPWDSSPVTTPAPVRDGPVAFPIGHGDRGSTRSRERAFAASAPPLGGGGSPARGRTSGRSAASLEA